jgi:hypothetical protein
VQLQSPVVKKDTASAIVLLVEAGFSERRHFRKLAFQKGGFLESRLFSNAAFQKAGFSAPLE